MDAASVSSSSSAADIKKTHVLLVDDCTITRMITSMLLSKNASCTVTTAENGFKALELLGLSDDNNQSSEKIEEVNMIITDFDMPGMNGLELLKKIKESSTVKDVPVVVVSSVNDGTMIKNVLKAGARMYMTKPLKPSDIDKLVPLMK